MARKALRAFLAAPWLRLEEVLIAARGDALRLAGRLGWRYRSDPKRWVSVCEVIVNRALGVEP